LHTANNLLATLDITNSIAGLRRTLNEAESLLKRVDGRVDPLATTLSNTLSDARQTLADLRRGIQNVADAVGPNGSLRSEASQALVELGNASRAVADLAEFLQRNPNSVLAGRKRQKPAP